MATTPKKITELRVKMFKAKAGGRDEAVLAFEDDLRCILKRCALLSRKRPIIFQCGKVSLSVHPDLTSEAIEVFIGQAHSPYIHISNLGLRDSSSRVRWHRLRFTLPRRLGNSLIGILCSLLPASEIKNTLYRMIGVRIGRNVEISFGAFIDPFSPGLISIGDETVVGTLSLLMTHAYRGRGRLFFGRITIGKGCLVGGMALIGPGVIEDEVTVLPGVVTLPFLQHMQRGAIVGSTTQPQDIRAVVVQLLSRLNFPREAGED